MQTSVNLARWKHKWIVFAGDCCPEEVNEVETYRLQSTKPCSKQTVGAGHPNQDL
jgi:hypothetical protein